MKLHLNLIIIIAVAAVTTSAQVEVEEVAQPNVIEVYHEEGFFDQALNYLTGGVRGKKMEEGKKNQGARKKKDPNDKDSEEEVNIMLRAEEEARARITTQKSKVTRVCGAEVEAGARICP
ncbi:hypothetical protein QTG54_008343 [Skeletonema marinoi]|uniref:Uncharacterized protein n=1 Tax=Skeletonema marinoi TaxID=267567 RepID=A0AAD8Y983_9STRA|nr:hypothetical protein QTG54_008343 [Skeletonema marinoi]